MNVLFVYFSFEKLSSKPSWSVVPVGVSDHVPAYFSFLIFHNNYYLLHHWYCISIEKEKSKSILPFRCSFLISNSIPL